MENFIVNGEVIVFFIINLVIIDELSSLIGIEIFVVYCWESGIGVKFGYNYVDIDFEFEDSNYGSMFEIDLDGVII